MTCKLHAVAVEHQSRGGDLRSFGHTDFMTSLVFHVDLHKPVVDMASAPDLSTLQQGIASPLLRSHHEETRSLSHPGKPTSHPAAVPMGHFPMRWLSDWLSLPSRFQQSAL
jgi:hypothetical protein